MRAGKLRHRVTIERPNETRDGIYGATKTTFVPLADVWASIEPTAGRETEYTEQTLAQSTHKVTIRFLAGLDSRMRVNFKGRILNIVAVNNFEERNIYQTLMCVETAITK